MTGRSRVERLPKEALAEVHAAIRDGDTIDGITRRMRAKGGTCSRAAVGRYVKRNGPRLRRQAEDDDPGERRQSEGGKRPEGGEPPEGGSAQHALEKLRGLVTSAATAIEQGRPPPDIQQIGGLALAIGRIENAGKAGAEQQKAAAREGARQAAGRHGPARQGKGLSPDAVAHICAAVEGYWGIEDPSECEEAVSEAYQRLKAQDAEGE